MKGGERRKRRKTEAGWGRTVNVKEEQGDPERISKDEEGGK